jgi:hypothetical protein
MTRECQVRFREGLRVKFPRSTRPDPHTQMVLAESLGDERRQAARQAKSYRRPRASARCDHASYVARWNEVPLDKGLCADCCLIELAGWNAASQQELPEFRPPAEDVLRRTMDDASSQLGLVSIASCSQNARKIEPLHPSDSIMGEPKS